MKIVRDGSEFGVESSDARWENTNVIDELDGGLVDGQVNDGTVSSNVEDGVKVLLRDRRELNGVGDELLGRLVLEELGALGILSELQRTNKCVDKGQRESSKGSGDRESCTDSLGGTLVHRRLSSGGRGKRELERVLEDVVRVAQLGEVPACLAASYKRTPEEKVNEMEREERQRARRGSGRERGALRSLSHEVRTMRMDF